MSFKQSDYESSTDFLFLILIDFVNTEIVEFHFLITEQHSTEIISLLFLDTEVYKIRDKIGLYVGWLLHWSGIKEKDALREFLKSEFVKSLQDRTK